ncbi:MAG: hypothetical protein M5R42_10345 [Rhodocyclaceae bacterium]|nr:hypothetical protein [Rhodocyclaceae bacterium]
MGELEAALSHYRALCASVPLKPLRTKKDYRRAVAVLDELLDAGAHSRATRSPNWPLRSASLLRITSKPTTNCQPPRPKTCWRFCCNSMGSAKATCLKSADQGIVSELLAGKRQVNARQARALGKRFGVPPGVFV